MVAVPPEGRELCPHCQRPFKRLRAHLPHCKAAPSAGSNSKPGTSAVRAPGPLPELGPSPGAVGKSSESSPAAARGVPAEEKGVPRTAPREPAAARKGKKKTAGEKDGGGSGSGSRRQADGRREELEVEPAVRDVAKCLDLLPEEVEDLPATLGSGVKIVIEKHRARVVRAGSRAGSSPGSSRSPPGVGRDPRGASAPGQPDPPPGRAVPGAANAGTRGAAEVASASSERGKGRKPPVLGDPPEAGSRSSPPELAKEVGRGKKVTGEEQMSREAGVEYKAPFSALHPEILHLSATEGVGGHREGASKSDLSSAQKPREPEQQMAAVSEPIPTTRRDRELALPPFSLHTSKNQPICLSRAPGRSTLAGGTGMEWFPDFYPSYHSIFPRKPFQESEGITVKTPRSSSSEAHRGSLSERHLLDVRLGELPTWLATCDFSAQGLLGGVQKAWSSYYTKYINVKRGGPAGISMLLAGYCLLSYSWNYQHLKHHRWRKYH